MVHKRWQDPYDPDTYLLHIIVYEAREKLLSILIYDTNELTLDYLRVTKFTIV